MKLLIGLGNPGKEYDGTRHNAGFLVLDELARRHGLTFKAAKALKGETATGEINGVPVRLLKPQTYMNASGESVRAAMKKDNVKAKDLLVTYDDADMAFAELKFRSGGGSGGHNGVASILEALPKDSELARVKLGIGRSPHPDVPLDAWVLGKWTKEESQTLPSLISKGADRIEEWLKN